MTLITIDLSELTSREVNSIGNILNKSSQDHDGVTNAIAHQELEEYESKQRES